MRGVFGVWNQREGKEWKKRVKRSEYVFIIWIYEKRIMKPVKIVFKKGAGIRKNNSEGGYDQHMLHACIWKSQWNPFVRWIHANKNKQMHSLMKNTF
jgi:hypothetical protein